MPIAQNCERAAGALLDYGVRAEDISLIANDRLGNNRAEAGSYGTPGVAPSTVAYNPATGNYTNPVGEAAQSVASTDASTTDAGWRGGETRGAVLDRPSNTLEPAFRGDTVSDYDVNRDRDSANNVYDNTDRNATALGNGSLDANYAATATDHNVNDDRRDTPKDIESAAKNGISTTTPGDAAAGAAKGAGIGLGLGVLAGLAALAIPGVGFVIGSGALASAIGLAVGTTAAGAVAGGVTGYFKDQGVSDTVAEHYSNTVEAGGAVLAVTVPSNNVDVATAQGLLEKYGASNVSNF